MKIILKICAICLLAFSPAAHAQQKEAPIKAILIGGGALVGITGGLLLAGAEEECRVRDGDNHRTCAKDDGQSTLGRGLIGGGVGLMLFGVFFPINKGNSAIPTRWRFHAADGIPKAVYPLSEKMHFSFGINGKAHNYDGVAIGLKLSL